MYKVITHNIKEEHYDHPITAEAGMMSHSSNISPGQISSLALMAGNELMLRPSSVEFRMNIRSLLSRFFWRTRDYLISLLDSRESSDVESELYKNIDEIGSFINTYYGTTISDEFNNSLKDIIKGLIFVVRDIKSGKDISDSKIKVKDAVNMFSILLNRINPTQWPYVAIFDIFIDLTNNWMGQISSRKMKDWVEDMQLVDKNEDIMLSGNDFTGISSFSEIFSKGIIAEYQQRFM